MLLELATVLVSCVEEGEGFVLHKVRSAGVAV